jgi:peptidoglycan hydrolase-like protein with peptidoglycan-binding domain
MPNNATITADQLRTVFLATELGSNTRDLNRFSYAQTGESTYSFGLLQFDVGKNGADVKSFLKENGFSTDDIAELSQHGGLSRKQLDTLDAKLQAIPQDKIDHFTNKQLDQVVARVDKTIDLVREKNPAAADIIAKSPSLQLAIADYDNQFHITDLDHKHPSSNGFVAYLQGNAVTLAGGTIKAGEPLTRDDIQKFINNTKYGVAEHQKDEKHDAAKSRANRLDQAMYKLGFEAVSANAQQPSSQSKHGAISADGIVKEGDQGAAVHDLQTSLVQLGYKDGHGHPLKVDGNFGLDTRHAVEKFQRDHHLTVDGKAGPATEKALDAQVKAHAQAAPGLDNPRNTDHALYQQALAGVRQLDAQAGRASDQHSANLAAALVVAAKKEGMTRIDHVALSTDGGTRVFAVQSDESVHKYANVPTLPSLNMPIEQSSAAVQQLNQQQAQQAAQPPVQPTIPTPTQSAPAMSR